MFKKDFLDLANCSYFVSDKLPSLHVTDQVIRKFLKQKFPEALMSLNDSRDWVVKIGPAAMIFWQGVYTVDDEDKPCVMFRQGHNYGLLDWIEKEIFCHLQQTYGGLMFDDANGDGNPMENEFQPCSTFHEYLKWKHRRSIERGQTYCKAMIDEELADHADWFPSLQRFFV